MRPSTRCGGGVGRACLRDWGFACQPLALTAVTPCPLQLGLDMEELEEIEEDAGLGNGGLGRLAGEWSGGQGMGWAERFFCAGSLTPSTLHTPSLLSGLYGNTWSSRLWLWNPL